MNWNKISNIKPAMIVFPIIFVALSVGFYSTFQKEKSLSKNNKTTLGKVTKLKYGKNGYIKYEFYANGKLYQVSDPDDAGWPKYVRNTKAILNRFYQVEYDSSKPYNAKILIDINSKSERELLNKGVKINAIIDKAFATSGTYIDLYIKYTYDKGDFSFRTRLHKDSLPCGKIEDCKASRIDLVIAKEYPELNNLYHKSYDRQSMKNAKLKK
ncbi:hypothetical protein ACNR9Q_00420 [Maribacter sp. X9]|uniref:hypothetical protein n=1 Tax=Maribacter sp. X9 TaxID=3402159 RepID=UPI003AF403FA